LFRDHYKRSSKFAYPQSLTSTRY